MMELYMLAGYYVWYVIGAIVCTLADDENGSLLKRARSFPFGRSIGLGVFLVIMCFPAVLYMRLKNR